MAGSSTHSPPSSRWADRFPVMVLAACALLIGAVGAWLAFDRPTASTPLPYDGVANAERSGGIELGQGEANPAAKVDDLLRDVAAAMGAVTSVEFELSRTEAPIYIDQFQSITLDHLIGQFELPANAQAAIDVTIEDNAKTRIGAIAFEREVWVSNPVTGDFETLPPGYDIDPSKFFDPSGGWQPLIEHLTDTAIVSITRRDAGALYHVTGTAAAADVSNITVGLIRDQDVAVDMWIDPGTSLVTHLEFVTKFGDADSIWTVDLRDFGADFTIAPPPNIPATVPAGDSRA